MFDASDADESVWLEWKSTLDLTKKHAWWHIARAIIGFANRMPDAVARFTEGRAYLVVGISPGALTGVTPIDVVDLDQGLTPYLGKEDQPRWRATFVPLTRGGVTAQVLIVEIDPPRWGDPPYYICKEYDGARDGEIFIRVNGATRPPKSHELKALHERFRRGAQEIQVELRVVAGAPVQPIDTRLEVVDDWLASRRRDAMASLVSWEQKQAADRPTRSYSSLGSGEPVDYPRLFSAFDQFTKTTPETRTPEEYRQQVEAYVRKCAERWPGLVVAGAAAHIAPIELELINALPANLTDVEVELYIPGDVHAVRPRSARTQVANEQFVDLPHPPLPYGPRVESIFSDVPGYKVSRPLGYGLIQPQVSRSWPRIDNGGSTRITFPVVHLRPHQQVRLDPIVVVVQTPAPSPLVGGWRATSTSMDGTVVGELRISVSGEPVPLGTILRKPDTWR
ncbi:ATP-binding protein [Sphaerisporangium album]|uniref:ATP-binding protein n=1 Tax=Sphaerisporangium album TaxID=509200 RepID=A0A367EHR6_9ACTN|nr:ATP-binding protein [Sphaerisporangium album]